MPRREREPEDEDRLGPLLRRADQLVIAVVVGVSLLLISVSLVYRHQRHNGLIEIDRSPPRTAQFLVDINQADWPELTLLPGVGPTLAQRIVDSRAEQGAFHNVDDLTRVPGIGPKKAARIAPYLTLAQQPGAAQQAAVAP